MHRHGWLPLALLALVVAVVVEGAALGLADGPGTPNAVVHQALHASFDGARAEARWSTGTEHPSVLVVCGRSAFSQTQVFACLEQVRRGRPAHPLLRALDVIGVAHDLANGASGFEGSGPTFVGTTTLRTKQYTVTSSVDVTVADGYAISLFITFEAVGRSVHHHGDVTMTLVSVDGRPAPTP